ncbi:MAG TPA: hypothetical protein VFH27_07580, partial [Longimicrobiaceae bacterium]|nr:hypothetical protein [Longimicrobiaceae bacterium]
SRTYEHPAVGWWNATVRLATWATIAVLLATVRLYAQSERDRRASGGGMRLPAGPEPFYTAVEMAFAALRTGGAPFTLVYVETAGLHRSDDGDGETEVRERVMQALRGTMRRSDRIAAPRGREVSLLLSDTGADVAGIALGRMAGVLREMIQASGRLDAGALVGAVTCVEPQGDVNGVLQRAFQQMYFAPRLPGQVSISHDTFPGAQPAEPALAEPAAT